MQPLQLTKKYEKYPEYKDSGVEWLGKIPKGWKIMKLKQVLDYEQPGEYVSSEIVGQDYHENEKVTPVLTANKGFILGYTSDKIGIFNKNFPVIIFDDFTTDKKLVNFPFKIRSTALKILKTKNRDNDIKFLFRNMEVLKPAVLEHNRHWISIYSNENIAWPTNIEQQKIIEFLDRKIAVIDQAIEKKQKQIKLLKERRTAIINDAVTKGLDPNVEMVDTGADWIKMKPKSWSIEKLKNRIFFLNGYSFNSDEYVEYGLPIIRISDVGQAIDFSQVKRVPYILRSKVKKFLVKKYDLLVALTGGTIGKTSIYDGEEEAYLNQRVGIIRPGKQLNLSFLKYQISSDIFKKNIDLFCMGGAQPNIGKNEIGNIYFVFPDIVEQGLIAEYLDKKVAAINEVIIKIEKSIELLQEFKSSLISNVVTGKIKV